MLCLSAVYVGCLIAVNLSFRKLYIIVEPVKKKLVEKMLVADINVELIDFFYLLNFFQLDFTLKIFILI